MDAPQKPRIKTTTVLIVLVLVFIEIFLLLDFRLLSGQANSSSQVSTYAMGIDKGSQLPMSQVLDVYVIGSSRLENRLSKALTETLAGNLIASTIEIRDGDPAASERSVLVVELAQPDTLWTPFFGRADIEMLVAYASDGEVDWIDEQSVDLNNASPVVRVRGDYQMSSNAYGVMSVPGYRSYLAQELAEQIASSLRERLSNPNP